MLTMAFSDGALKSVASWSLAPGAGFPQEQRGFHAELLTALGNQRHVDIRRAPAGFGEDRAVGAQRVFHQIAGDERCALALLRQLIGDVDHHAYEVEIDAMARVQVRDDAMILNAVRLHVHVRIRAHDGTIEDFVGVEDSWQQMATIVAIQERFAWHGRPLMGVELIHVGDARQGVGYGRQAQAAYGVRFRVDTDLARQPHRRAQDRHAQDIVRIVADNPPGQCRYEDHVMQGGELADLRGSMTVKGRRAHVDDVAGQTLQRIDDGHRHAAEDARGATANTVDGTQRAGEVITRWVQSGAGLDDVEDAQNATRFARLDELELHIRQSGVPQHFGDQLVAIDAEFGVCE